MAGLDFRMRPGGGGNPNPLIVIGIGGGILVAVLFISGVLPRQALEPVPELLLHRRRRPLPHVAAAPVYSRTIVRAALPRQPVVLG